MWGHPLVPLCLEVRDLAVLLLLLQLWGRRKRWSRWMIYKSFVCKVRPILRNTGAIRADNSRFRRNQAPISGTAQYSSICETALWTPMTGSTTILERRSLPFGKAISEVHLADQSESQACITEKIRCSSLSPTRGCAWLRHRRPRSTTCQTFACAASLLVARGRTLQPPLYSNQF